LIASWMVYVPLSAFAGAKGWYTQTNNKGWYPWEGSSASGTKADDKKDQPLLSQSQTPTGLSSGGLGTGTASSASQQGTGQLGQQSQLLQQASQGLSK
jgi:hypothetical protein